jgi:hypothetical protein
MTEGTGWEDDAPAGDVDEPAPQLYYGSLPEFMLIRAIAVAHTRLPEANAIWTEDALRIFSQSGSSQMTV